VLCFAMGHCPMITFCLFLFWYEFYQATWHVLAATVLQII
jgi:intracellular septation protein A